MTNVTYNSEDLTHRKVYYAGEDTLKAGYCLCYDRSFGQANEAAPARAYRVVKPAEGNIRYFAGVVADDQDGRTGPCWVTVVEPALPGRLVKVFTNQNCTLGVTRLGLVAGSYAAGAAGASSPAIALAMQTLDCSAGAAVMAQLEGAPALTVKPAAAVTQTQVQLTHDYGYADFVVDDVGEIFYPSLLNNNFREITVQLMRIHADIAAIITSLRNANILA
ncbi:MAG: hypothetical protein GXY38_10525 [Planctomycetes bacterium]|jgi:hypothetical protein|nr:hypothetical protein [Planctomycetota bacterium]